MPQDRLWLEDIALSLVREVLACWRVFIYLVSIRGSRLEGFAIRKRERR
jgi:hypothetical protein